MSAEVIEMKPDEEPISHIEPIATLEEMLPRFVHIAEEDAVYDLQAVNGGTATLPWPRFERAYAHSKMTVMGGRNNTTPKQVPLTKQWIEHPAKLSVFGRTYDPLTDKKVILDPDQGRAYVNAFWMPTWARRKVSKAAVQPFLEHMALLVPEKEEREVVIDWLAHLLQYPGVRNKFALLMVAAKEGTGRGWLVQLMTRLLGFNNVKPFSMKEFDSEFDDAFVSCLLNVVEEICESNEGKYTLAEKLKDRVTGQSSVANMKHGAKKLVRYYSSLLMQSNHPNAIAVRDTDRRVMVVATKAEPQPDAYYIELYGRLADREFLADVAAFLLQRDLTKFRTLLRAPMTAAKQETIAATMTEVDDVVETFIEDCPEHYFTSNQVARFFKIVRRLDGTDDGPLNTKQIGAVLLRLAERVPRLGGNQGPGIKFRGRKERPWQKRGTEGARTPRQLNEDVRQALERVDRWLLLRDSQRVRETHGLSRIA
jgi:hypothetical protein